ncbi:MAG: hypothetical protein K6T17_09105 [Fimbriimonadales bacterium]|nr:hypothetical protein [Fimbriimonadales bacterium]
MKTYKQNFLIPLLSCDAGAHKISPTARIRLPRTEALPPLLLYGAREEVPFYNR